jgi:hypothetical protein
LHFDISTPLFYGVKDYVDKVYTILSSFVDEFLKPLDKGHSELKICLTWTGYEGWGGYEDEVSKEWKWDEFTIYKRSFLRLFHKTMSFSPLVQNSRLRIHIGERRI